MKCCRDIINTFTKNLSTGLIKKKRDKKINTIYDNIGFFVISVYSIRFKYTCPSHLTEIFISAALDRLQSNSRF